MYKKKKKEITTTLLINSNPLVQPKVACVSQPGEPTVQQHPRRLSEGPANRGWTAKLPTVHPGQSSHPHLAASGYIIWKKWQHRGLHKIKYSGGFGRKASCNHPDWSISCQILCDSVDSSWKLEQLYRCSHAVCLIKSGAFLLLFLCFLKNNIAY